MTRGRRNRSLARTRARRRRRVRAPRRGDPARRAAPGSPLPPERVLAERYGVSRIIARQGVHRLAEWGLCACVKGAHVVLDPHEATDLRGARPLLPLRAPLGRPRRPQPGRRLGHDREAIPCRVCRLSRSRPAGPPRRASSRCASWSSASLRARPSWPLRRVRGALLAHARGLRARTASSGWKSAGGTSLAGSSPCARRRCRVALVRIGFYRELARRLAEQDAPTDYYLAIVPPILDAQIGPARSARRAKRAAR